MPETNVVLQIQGMTCDGCSQSIERALKRHRGVSRVKVDWRGGTGEVTFDPAETSEEAILDAPVFRGHYRAAPAGGCC